MERKRPSLPLVLVLFLASGLAGLVYQVVWARLLSRVLGVNIYAVTTVVCTFMAGLGLGSYAVARWGGRLARPLRAYGVIEVSIAVYAALTPALVEALEPLYSRAAGNLGPLATGGVRAGISALLLLLPTTLMGATLPLVARAVASDSTAARSVGLLYGVNTFGAVVGCLLAGFVLLPGLGVRGSVLVAAGFNLAAGALALVAASGARASPVIRAPTRSEPQARFVLAVFFLAGFAALGYEVLWTRALLVYLRSSTYAFTVMLAVYLVGVASGSVFAARFASRSRDPLRAIAVCQVGVVASVVAGLLAFPHLEAAGRLLTGSHRPESFAAAVGLMLIQASLVLLLPTACMGAMFPFGVRAFHVAAHDVGRSVGSLYAANTAGNIAGALLIGFGAIGWFGVRHSLVGMVALNLALAAAVAGRRPAARRTQGLAICAAVGALAAVHLGIPERLFYRSIAKAGDEIVYYREGASDTVAVLGHPGPEPFRTLIYSDGRGASGTWTLPWNLYLGHLPMLLHPDPREVLHICIGAGNSLAAIARHGPARIDAVELSPHVREAARFFWTNDGVLDDPSVHFIAEDGRNFLLRSRDRYDVISMEPPLIFTAGVIDLYTQEFYALVRQHLEADGVALQWLPLRGLSEADRGHLLRAFAESFPAVSIWQQLATPVLLLIGTQRSLELDLDAIQRRLAAPRMARDLEIMGTPNAEVFLSYFLLGDESTRRLAAPYEPVRDDRTIVDYSLAGQIEMGFGPYGEIDPAEMLREMARETEKLGRWRDPLSLILPDPVQAERVEAARQRRP